MSREHVVPKWLSITGAADGGGQYIIAREGREIRTPMIEVVTRRVCENCNTGWLSRIESGAAPVLKGLLDASSKTISEVERWIVARWFTKTILTAQLALTARSDTGILHPQDYRTFFDHAQPFNNQFTMIAGYQGPLPPILFEVYSPDETTNRGVRVLFHFQRVVILAFFMNTDEPASLHLPHRFDEASHIIWPMQRGLLRSDDPTLPLSWPPPFVVEGDTIERLRRLILPTS